MHKLIYRMKYLFKQAHVSMSSYSSIGLERYRYWVIGYWAIIIIIIITKICSAPFTNTKNSGGNQNKNYRLKAVLKRCVLSLFCAIFTDNG